MPELPDVEVYRRHLARRGLHRRIRRVHHVDPQMLDGVSRRALRDALTGSSLEATRRHGKWLFARCGTEEPWLVLHFGMTGRLHVSDAEVELPEHTRLAADFDDGGRLVYECQRKFGAIGLTDTPEGFVEQHDLGPDVLALDVADFTGIFERGHGSVKSTLMNQSIVAGLGNVYTDEVLFQAGVDPRTSVSDLDARTRRRVARVARRVLRTAIDRHADPERLPRSWLLGHREAGARCPRDGATVARVRVGGRSTYLCPACQGR